MALQDAVPKQLVDCPFHRLSSDGGLAEEGQSGGRVCILCPETGLLVLPDVMWCAHGQITPSSCFDAGRW